MVLWVQYVKLINKTHTSPSFIVWIESSFFNKPMVFIFVVINSIASYSIV